MHSARLPALVLFLLPAAAPAVTVPGPLVDSGWVAAHLEAVVILDVREDPRRFATEGHIPGAVTIGWRALQTERRENGVTLIGMVPDEETVTELMRAKGVGQASAVVITGPGESLLDTTEMARLYWTLKYYGHEEVAILDGGNARWKQEGHPFSTSREPAVERGDFQARPQPQLLATTSQVAAAVQAGQTQLVDVRTLGYYLGLFKEPYVDGAGHIPGAKLYPYTLALTRNPVRFRSREELRALAEALGVDLNRPTIVYCNTGVLSAAGWFIFHELLGNEKARLYDGSIHAWTRLGHGTEVMRLNLD